MLDHVAMEHVHPGVIGELELELDAFAGTQIPCFFHGFVRITCSTVAADTLLIDVVHVNRVRLCGGICKDPPLSGA